MNYGLMKTSVNLKPTGRRMQPKVWVLRPNVSTNFPGYMGRWMYAGNMYAGSKVRSFDGKTNYLVFTDGSLRRIKK